MYATGYRIFCNIFEKKLWVIDLIIQYVYNKYINYILQNLIFLKMKYVDLFGIIFVSRVRNKSAAGEKKIYSRVFYSSFDLYWRRTKVPVSRYRTSIVLPLLTQSLRFSVDIVEIETCFLQIFIYFEIFIHHRYIQEFWC